MTLRPINRDVLSRISDGDHRAIRFFEDIAETIGELTGGAISVDTSSGTAIDLTDIPPSAREITLQFDGLSLSGTDNAIVQMGTAAGVENSAYVSTSVAMVNATSPVAIISTAGFVLSLGSAARALTGTLVLSKVEAENYWIASGSLIQGTLGAVVACGSKQLAGVADRVRITRTGADAFDAGRVVVGWRA